MSPWQHNKRHMLVAFMTHTINLDMIPINCISSRSWIVPPTSWNITLSDVHSSFGRLVPKRCFLYRHKRCIRIKKDSFFPPILKGMPNSFWKWILAYRDFIILRIQSIKIKPDHVYHAWEERMTCEINWTFLPPSLPPRN